MQISIIFNTDSSSFEDNHDEISDILERVGENATLACQNGHCPCDGTIRDTNGNTVGTWKVAK